ncbi:MAG: hypothetical protein JST12_18055 [Armatimonadetes bacterium]|nr:hypothetical protein [Armatimonadota bacterium]
MFLVGDCAVYSFWGFWGYVAWLGEVHTFVAIALGSFSKGGRSGIEEWGSIGFGLCAALMAISVIVSVVRNRRQRIEVEGNTLRYYKRHEKPMIECPFSSVVDLTYTTFLGFPSAYTIHLPGRFCNVKFHWWLANRRRFIETVEHKTGLRFELESPKVAKSLIRG